MTALRVCAKCCKNPELKKNFSPPPSGSHNIKTEGKQTQRKMNKIETYDA